MTIFTFPYIAERTRSGLLRFRPFALVHLQGADGCWYPFPFYVDAGADVTLLREGDCRLLGYELEAGKLQFMGGVCTGLIRTFVHQISLRLGTETLPCSVAFAEKVDVPRLLGREGVFDHFKVCYDDARRMTDFILREEQG